MEPFFNLPKEKFLEGLEKYKPNMVIDVRNPDEFDQGHLPNAELIPFDNPDFIANMADHDHHGRYFIYCKSGARGSKACLMLRSMGFDGEIFHLQGGYESLNS
jgi:rhodanese-related sulfurtransferase